MKKPTLFFIPLMSISFLTNCGGSEKIYHVKFTNGNELVEEKDYKANEIIVAPTSPEPYEKNHKIYTFDGWCDGDTKFVEGTKATKNVEYVAKFNSEDAKYTVTFLNEGKEYKKVTDAKYGDVIVAPETNPTKEADKKYNYKFNTWLYQGTKTEFKEGDKVEGNTIIVADYNKDSITYTATFKKTGEQDIRIEFNVDSLSVKAPAFTSTRHYTGIWSTDDGAKTVGSEETITFTENDLDDWEFKYVESATPYLITFVKNGTTVETITKKINDQSLNFTAPTFSPTSHYDGEWYCEELGTDGTSLGSGDICSALTSDNLNNYTFVYQEEEINYTILFKKEGMEFKTTVSYTNRQFTAPKIEATTHYDCVWVCTPWVGLESDFELIGGESYTLKDDELGNHTFVYTEVAHDYDVVFGSGTDYKGTQRISINSLIIHTPHHDVSEHYDSCVWKEGEIEIAPNARYTFTEEQLCNHTFTWTGKTAHQYKVTFKYADGTTESVIDYISMDKLTLTAPETKATSQDLNYHYAWKSDNFAIESESSFTFTENELKEYVFEETKIKNNYTITYVLGDEAAVNPETNPIKYKTTEAVTLVAPSLDGFTFKGWYLSGDEHNKLESNGWGAGHMVGDIIIYADWHIIDKTLDDYSWQEISEMSNNGTASKYFDIGDTKAVTIDNVDYQVRIIDYNYDVLATPSNDESRYAGITFDFVNVISGFTTFWNNKDGDRSTNYDFIGKSNLNECLQPEGEVYNKLNSVDGLMDVIKTVNKKVNIHPNDDWIEGSYNTKLFPLSYDEIDGNDDVTYEYYKIDFINRRIKGADYWTRSPDALHAFLIDAVLTVGEKGEKGFCQIFSRALAVAPAFCI